MVYVCTYLYKILFIYIVKVRLLCYYVIEWGEFMSVFTNEEKMLLELIKSDINSTKNDLCFDGLDFDLIFKNSNEHSVNMLVFDSLNFNDIQLPQDVLTNWLYFTSRKMTIRENVLLVQKQLTKLLEQNDVRYFVFKGFSASTFYKNPQLRECGDIDVFVEKEEFEEIKKLLCDNGFKLADDSNDMHWSFVRSGVEVELHHRFWDVYENEFGSFTKKYLSDSLNHVIEYSVDDYSFYGPDYIRHGLILILHLINHIQSGGIGLRHVCDFAYFANSKIFADNLDEFKDVCEKCGVSTVFNVVSNICFKYLGVLNCSYAKGYKQQLCDLVLKDILTSGNFGRLNQSEYYASNAFTSKRKKNENVFKRVFRFCQTAWEPCKRYKVLLVIAPFYVFIRYLFRVLLGKRPKVNFVKMMKKSSQRNSIYSQLNIFGEDL